jgi:hypothetical protein
MEENYLLVLVIALALSLYWSCLVFRGSFWKDCNCYIWLSVRLISSYMCWVSSIVRVSILSLLV